MGTLFVLIVAISFGIVRFMVPVHGLNDADIFKDLAHIFVGGLFGAAIAETIRDYNQQTDWVNLWTVAVLANWRLWAMAWGLTGLEVAAFFIRKGGAT